MEEEHPLPLVEAQAPEKDPERGSVGSVLSIILIVALLVVGAFYVWGQRIAEQRANQYVPAVAQ